MIKIDCYIEEYKNQKIFYQLDSEIKERTKNLNKNHLLQFLSQAKFNQDIMPTIYEQTGEDKIVVRGYIVSSTDESIEVCIDIENGGYLFA